MLSRMNMADKFFLFLGLTALVRGAVVPAVPAAVAVATAPLAKLEEFDTVPQYSFAYDVQDARTGDSKAQYETRNGDIVRGSYSLIEADGTRRIVEYTADPINGFNAIVSREPATALIAAIAAPSLVPLKPALTPAAPIAPMPSIPAVGPDSDVEVVEARSGPLTVTTRERQLQRLQKQPLQKQLARLQIQQQQQQQQIVARVVDRVQPAVSARLAGLAATARAIATYPTYPYTTYTAAYSSPLAYAAPVTGLTYTSAATLA